MSSNLNFCSNGKVKSVTFLKLKADSVIFVYEEIINNLNGDLWLRVNCVLSFDILEFYEFTAFYYRETRSNF